MDDTSNRVENSRNPHQNIHKKVLAICSASLLRSPTIAWVLSNPPYNCNTRCAGAVDYYALQLIDRPLLCWCEEIVCADRSHEAAVEKKLKEFNLERPVHCLKIPDEYQYRDPDLVRIIHKALERVGFRGTSK